MKIKDVIISIVIVIVLVLAIGITVEYGIRKAEIRECKIWRQEAKIYDNYYLTDWQREQCQHYNINIEL